MLYACPDEIEGVHNKSMRGYPLMLLCCGYRYLILAFKLIRYLTSTANAPM